MIMDKPKSRLRKFFNILGIIAGIFTVYILKALAENYTIFLGIMLVMTIIAAVSVYLAMSNPSRKRRGTVTFILGLLLMIFFIISLATLNSMSLGAAIVGMVSLYITYKKTKDEYLSALMGAFAFGVSPIISVIVSAIIYHKYRNDKEKAIYIIELFLLIQLIIETFIAVLLIYL